MLGIVGTLIMIVWGYIYATLERDQDISESSEEIGKYKKTICLFKKLKGLIHSSCMRQQIRDQWINVS